MVVQIVGDKVYLNGVIVGEILGDCYLSRRDSKKHYYVMGGGYPISNEILKELKTQKPNVVKAKILENGAKALTLYSCPIEKYRDAVMIEVGGFEQQRCVPLKEMTVEQVYPK